VSINNARQLALDLIARGFAPVPVPIGGKGPNIRNWPQLKITDENIDRFFNGARINVGAIMGARSGNLADVDLDCKEAVDLAPHFLPRTDSIYGRPGKRRSHYLYKCDDPDPKASIKLNDEHGGCIVELRLGGAGKGAQSLMPGSTHTSGERYQWDVDGIIASAPCATLKAAITKVAVATILIRNWPAQGSRHDAVLMLGGFFSRAGWNADEVEYFITTVCAVHGEAADPAGAGRTARDSAEHRAEGGQVYGFPQMKETFGEAVAKRVAQLIGYRSRDAVAEPSPVDGRPVIKLEGGGMSRVAFEAERALIGADVQFYERANTLVRPLVKDVDTFHGRQTKASQLVIVDHAYMRDAMCQNANWYKIDRRGRAWASVDPPHDVVDTLLARSGGWSFPTIAGIITTPTMRPDGTILSKLGFDPATRLLVVDSPAMPPIPERPTKDDAVRALKLFEDLLEEFKFVDEVAKAGALSAILTLVARAMFPVVPMHVVDAPLAGTGKSYMSNIFSAIATGQEMPVITAGSSEEETEKRIGSAVLAGRTLVTIDNVTSELGGASLCQLISEMRPSIRILGRSELVEVETRGISFFANGNNIIIVGDLCRRVIRIRLDAKVEHPETRIFKADPMAKVLGDRGKYIAAALIVCRAYVVAGRPGRLPPRLASFEAWSDTVRSALVWLGKEDPAKSIDTSHAEDPDRLTLMAIHREWATVFGTGKTKCVLLKEVIEACEKRTMVNYGPPAEFRFDHPDLRSAVQGIMKDQRQLSVKDFGYWMRGKKNRIVAGMYFEHADTDDGTKWWVEKATGNADATTAATNGGASGVNVAIDDDIPF
jgi:hypothetical protein